MFGCLWRTLQEFRCRGSLPHHQQFRFLLACLAAVLFTSQGSLAVVDISIMPTSTFMVALNAAVPTPDTEDYVFQLSSGTYTGCGGTFDLLSSSSALTFTLQGAGMIHTLVDCQNIPLLASMFLCDGCSATFQDLTFSSLVMDASSLARGPSTSFGGFLGITSEGSISLERVRLTASSVLAADEDIPFAGASSLIRMTDSSTGLIVVDCLFDFNTCDAGIIHAFSGGDVVLTGSLFEHNTATGDLNGGSGAVYNGNGAGSLTISDCAFDGNHAVQDGGAIFCYNLFAVSILDSVVERCSAVVRGGFMLAYSTPSVEVLGIDVLDCRADEGGGFAYAFSVNTTVTDFDVRNCSSSTGGVFFVEGGGKLNASNVVARDLSTVTEGGGFLYSEEVTAVYVHDLSAVNMTAYEGAEGSLISDLRSNYVEISNLSLTAAVGKAIFLSASGAAVLRDIFAENLDSGLLTSAEVTNLLVERCEVSSASNPANGGVFMIEDGTSAVLIDITVSNSSAVAGGVLWAMDWGSLTVNGLSSTHARGSSSGGVFFFSFLTFVELSDIDTFDSLALGEGGVAFLSSSVQQANITNMTSELSHSDEAGGVFLASSSQVAFFNLTATRSSSLSGGGVLAISFSDVVIIHSTFTDSLTNGEGAVLQFLHTTASVVNCIFSAASSFFGGIASVRHSFLFVADSMARYVQSDNGGGAFYSVLSELNMTSMQIEHSHSSQFGGVIYLSGSTAALVDCQVQHVADVTSAGVAFIQDHSQISFVRSFFNNCSSVSGAAILQTFASSESTFSDCTLSNLRGLKGAMLIKGSGVSIVGCDVKNVVAACYSESACNTFDFVAGFLTVDGGSGRMESTNVTNCTTGGYGCGVLVASAFVEITDCLFNGSWASIGGGTIAVGGNPYGGICLRVTRTHIANSFAPEGGALLVLVNSIEVNSCTVENVGAVTEGGFAYFDSGESGTATIIDTSIAGVVTLPALSRMEFGESSTFFVRDFSLNLTRVSILGAESSILRTSMPAPSVSISSLVVCDEHNGTMPLLACDGLSCSQVTFVSDLEPCPGFDSICLCAERDFACHDALASQGIGATLMCPPTDYTSTSSSAATSTSSSSSASSSVSTHIQSSSSPNTTLAPTTSDPSSLESSATLTVVSSSSSSLSSSYSDTLSSSAATTSTVAAPPVAKPWETEVTCPPDQARRDEGCIPCPRGGLCNGTEWIWPRPGFWSESAFNTPYQCGVFEACPGATGETPGYEGFQIDENGPVTDLCSELYDGDFCAECEGSTKRDNQRCLPCGSAGETQSGGLIFVTIAVIAMVAFALVFLSDKRVDMLVSGILVAQTFSLVGRDAARHVTGKAGQNLSEAFRVLSLFNLDVEFLALDCAVGTPFRFGSIFWGSLVMWAVAAVLFQIAALIHVGILACHNQVKGADFWRRLVNRCTHSLVIFVMLSYLQLTLRAIQGLRCVRVNEESRLSVELSTLCFEGSHKGVAGMSIALFVVLIIPFPLFVFYIVLAQHREDGGDSVDESASQEKESGDEHLLRNSRRDFKERFGFLVRNVRANHSSRVLPALKVLLTLTVVLQLTIPLNISYKLMFNCLVVLVNVIYVAFVWPMKTSTGNLFLILSGTVTSLESAIILAAVVDPDRTTTPYVAVAFTIVALGVVAGVGAVLRKWGQLDESSDSSSLEDTEDNTKHDVHKESGVSAMNAVGREGDSSSAGRTESSTASLYDSEGDYESDVTSS